MSVIPAASEPIRRAAIANLGCKVNRAEMDRVERLLRSAGVDVVDVHEPADLVVINTCTVTSIAEAKSRQLVRRARRASPEARVVVTGCSVAVDPGSLAAIDPAAALYDNDSKGRLVAEMSELLGLPDGVAWPSLSGVEAAIDGTATVTASDELLPIDRTRAFIKIQDGCSFHCTYCIIPRARGAERSVPAGEVVREVGRALSAGHREVVLTGINVGTYADGDVDLAGLIGRILTETSVERIRLSSVEPQHVSHALLAVWTGSGGRCLPHFHIPLQSGDDAILRRMGRRYDTSFYSSVVARVRAALPAAAIHADLIAGFPGEDEAAWARSLEFLNGLGLAGIHVFRYSPRPGTPAARMVGQVDEASKKRRAAEALRVAARAREGFAACLIGSELRVLFEVPLADGRWLGHAANHVPVAVAPPAGASLDNSIGRVRAEAVDRDAPDRIVGRLLALDPPPGRLRGQIATRSPDAHEPLARSAAK